MRNHQFPDPHETWTEDEARAVFAAWRASDESLSAFARRHGIGVQRLYWWKRRLGSTTNAGSTLSLVPAKVIEAEAAAVTIRLPSGIAIEIASGSPRLVAAIVTELTRSSP
jgi:transposase-like protein